MADEADDLADYDEEEHVQQDDGPEKEAKKGSYVGIHSSGFKDFLLKPELLRSVVDCGFEHPSEVQHECIPQAILGMDVVCQAKSGMGKTAVFVLATLHQIEPVENQVQVLVLCHTRELAFQIHHEYERFSKFLKGVKTAVFYGGVPFKKHAAMLEENAPNVVIGTPGRILELVTKKKLDLSHLKHFVLDECDCMLAETEMRSDVQKIFRETPHDKQVLMFSATLAQEIRPVCKRFCQDALEVYVDDDAKLTLHGLQQYTVNLKEEHKNRKLTELFDELEFNQVIVFVSQQRRAKELNKLLVECNFPSICTYAKMKQTERIAILERFKRFEARILVTTDLFGRGIDIERVNLVINYDMASTSDAYLHRVNRAGRFGTRGLAVSFVSSPADEEVLETIQSRFEVKIPPMPDQLDSATYMNA